ncbi:DUF317 domain-containing protein [Streptomyces sp. NPDC015171]|uniref:DUF317 domain-containing protein n=1 Tax=Streptomyces sp. NPDC015171 TaxID=3364945 RepID=UPI0036F9D146
MSVPRRTLSTGSPPTTVRARFCVGWLPEDPSAWQRNIVWHVRVQPADGDAWIQEFGLHTPSEAVAGFLAVLVTNSSC